MRTAPQTSRMHGVTDLVVVGAGGHGRELLDTIEAINAAAPRWNLLGVVDDDPGENLERLRRRGVQWLGPVTALESSPSAYALGIGTSPVRRRLAAQLDSWGCTATTLVHPGASIGSDVRLGNGVVIYDRSVVTTNVTIGDHSHLNVACVVQHDSSVGSFAQFSPGVFVNGDCALGDDVFLGTGAIITRGCDVGEGARVGAGAVVLGDVAAWTTVVGAPAQPPR